MMRGAAASPAGRQISTWRPPSIVLSAVGAAADGMAARVRATVAATMAATMMRAKTTASAIRRMIRTPRTRKTVG
jgi:hypothetical protein